MRMRPAHSGTVAHSHSLNEGMDSVEVKSLGTLFREVGHDALN